MTAPLFELTEALSRRLRGDEVLLLAHSGESTDFVRLNHNRVRQGGHVEQGGYVATLIRGRRQVSAQYRSQGDPAVDRGVLIGLLGELRGQLGHLPEDPHLLHDREPLESRRESSAALPSGAEMTHALQGLADGLDLVGIVAAGTMTRGLASSLGHRHWHSTRSFHLDWSIHHRADKAVKGDYAGTDWSEARLAERVRRSRADLERMQHPPRTIPPGEYRAYLAPAALRDLLDMLAWGGFGLKSHHSGQSPLVGMQRAGRRLSSQVTLSESPTDGIAPLFIEEGFARPGRTTLIEAGQYRDFLVDPRAAKEFGVPVTGRETPDSLDLAAGTLAGDELLAQLDTGLWLNNLWYCNFSDRNQARITGMTRFACFWVEQGQIVAPLEVMRFDDSIYRLLGDQLLGLSREREFILDDSTYLERSTRSYRLPGILVERMRFTL